MAKTKLDFITIDDARFLEVCRLYFLYKDLNNGIKSVSSRGLNLPETISEPMSCYALGYKWNKGTKGGDATDENGSLIEIKATSNFDDDLSSFSPNTKFDKLIFFRLKYDKNEAYIYDLGLNSDAFVNLSVNKTQTVKDQQKLGRRPRLSLISYINQNNIQPVAIIDIVARIVKK
ncbi:Bsp6I family type II restriction endonuclease [Campylobacter suis]|uniref:Bsp6I family restriction endonuclease n=1 Tax=Campylobacter suis TaxID=2790657 RepID=A0ABN7K842_9BACT|nr:Bsp6I family type II restriction endonuclease [Campylobacter suis]CAD7288270.1 hypothetical protein LMG8286_01238 [Campylobacter suis]